MTKRIIIPPDVSIRYHPLCLLFPSMPRSAFEALRADITENGLTDPVVVIGYDPLRFENTAVVLDGRHRCEALTSKMRQQPCFVRYEDIAEGIDPERWVISKNLHRRQLTASQRAIYAANYARYHAQKRGEQAARIAAEVKGEAPPSREAQEEFGNLTKTKPTTKELEVAAKTFQVSAKSTRDAAKVIAASPDLAQQVERGDLAVNRAANVARIADEGQRNNAVRAVVAAPTKKAKREIAAAVVRTPAPPARPTGRPRVKEIVIKEQEVRCLIKMLEASTDPDAKEAVESLWERIGGEE